MKIETNQRLYHYGSFAALSFALIWALIYPFFTTMDMPDLEIFLRVGSGISWNEYFYSPWVTPFFSFLTIVPYEIAGMIVGVINVLCLWYAIEVFKGNKIILFLSYALFHMIAYGQIDGIYTAGMALMYVSLQRNHRVGAVIGWLLLLIRWNFGGPIGLGLLWMYGENRTKRDVLIAVIAFGILSLFIWGLWPIDFLNRLDDLLGGAAYNLSLWYLTGPLILVLWIPVLASRTQDPRWWVATWFLTAPYFNIHMFVHLLVFPVGLVGLIPQINFITSYIRGRYLAIPVLMQILPFWVYVESLRRSWETNRLRDLWLRWQVQRSATSP